MDSHRSKTDKTKDDEEKRRPEIVILDTIRRLDGLFEEDVEKVVRALVAYYNVDIRIAAQGQRSEEK
jgi:hypothetical protein